MVKRIVATLLLLISFFIFPYWITLSLSVAFLFVFKNYWEVILVFLFADLVYSIPQPRFWNFEYSLTVFAVILYFVVFILRKNLLKRD